MCGGKFLEEPHPFPPGPSGAHSDVLFLLGLFLPKKCRKTYGFLPKSVSEIECRSPSTVLGGQQPYRASLGRFKFTLDAVKGRKIAGWPIFSNFPIFQYWGGTILIHFWWFWAGRGRAKKRPGRPKFVEKTYGLGPWSAFCAGLHWA